MKITRRLFLTKMAQTVGLGLLTGAYAWQVEPFWLEFVYQKMPLKNLPKELEGKTLMQISDLHVDADLDWEYLIDSFKKAQKLNPDFVVYTGDFVNHGGKQQVNLLKEVFEHVVKGKLDTIGVLGNHDYGKNWSQHHIANQVVQTVEKAGVKMLRNNAVQSHEINFIGMDDFWSPNCRPQQALKSYKKKQANIVLCHNPDVADLPIWNDFQGWMLSGHTHGGQCKPPFLSPPMLPVQNKKYTSGQFDLGNGRYMYINRALGHVMQVRFNVRPEITIFKLENV